MRFHHESGEKTVAPIELEARPVALLKNGPPALGPVYAATLATRLDHGWSPLHALRTATHLYVRAPRAELYDVGADPGARGERKSALVPRHSGRDVVQGAEAPRWRGARRANTLRN